MCGCVWFCLSVFSGGVSENGLAGVNYPLRGRWNPAVLRRHCLTGCLYYCWSERWIRNLGEKHTNWAGGYRVAAFISGGVVPARLRGTTSNLRMHVVDWYPTFCAAAGLTAAQCSDDSPTAPLPTDPSNPEKDIYSNGAWPGLDGVDVSMLRVHSSPVPSCLLISVWVPMLCACVVHSTNSQVWPMLLKGGSGIEVDIYEAHHTIAISAEVLLVGEHKLLVGQGHVDDSGPKSRPTPDGKQPPTDVSPDHRVLVIESWSFIIQ